MKFGDVQQQNTKQPLMNQSEQSCSKPHWKYFTLDATLDASASYYISCIPCYVVKQVLQLYR